MRPRTPLHSKTAISLFTAARTDLSFVQLRSILTVQFLCAFLCSTDARNLNPSNPGFCPHTNPGLTSLKTFETPLPRFSGRPTRVAFPIRDKMAISRS